ncbi:unnamed protein product [Ceutorhynchus assimilis]|uniref:Piezo-type mechanosensitive ion channel component n=1 Tax=Ceutorhynchus assimilis TaxID=467358 RepID=A0A9N9MSI1_9CUCU|nr:unnamed protein product [Ceutorhynchus assimilis]
MWFYAALISTSLAGVMRPTIYSLGYLVGASIFIWEGTHIFLRPPEMILRRWNMLIGYNVVVMLIRTVNQIFGCILIHEIVSDCMIFKIFSIGCVDKFGLTAGVPNISENTACRALYASLGLAYDCICFFFLIFQQRIFKTYHFFHMVNDIKAQTILSNRGAELIVEQKRKKRQAIDLQDKTIRENIEKKLAKVRATHQRVHGNAYARKKTNQSYILKSSDYYMFDDAILNNDIPLRPETKQNVSKSDPYDPMPLTEYLKLFHDTDVATVLEKRDLRRRKRKLMQQGKNPRAVKTSPGPSTSNIRKDSRKTRKFLNIFLFIWGIFESLIVSTTLFFNERSKDFREILNEINAEKKILKEHSKYARGVRLGTNKVWSPVQDYRDLILARRDDKVEEQHDYQDSIYFNFISATWLLILSHTELLSYCIIIFNQYKRANFISLPMVILVFCWGTLTVPKPTKTFWVSTISYVLIMLFIKNFFVMDIIPWETNTHMSNLFFPPLIIGLNRYASLHINIFILVLLFLHRKVLQTLGLWKPYDYRIATLVDNGEYTLGDQKLVPLPVKDTTTKNPFVLETVEASFGDYFPNSIVPGFAKYAERLRLFAQQLIVPSFTQIPVDVYTPMFLCDLINLLIIIFFYGSFYKAESDEGFINFIQNNDVPISFLVVVLLYFLAMVIDRAIYLKKSRLNKIFYHFFQVIAVHIYFFILYPIITERIFIKTPVVQAFYIFKCFYFLLSTYQIKNGYPALISGHYLWHGTGTLRRFSYKIYNCIPYFFVMRTLLDWICTDSCLGVGDWFTMEDISQNIYENMCCTQTLEVPDSKQHTRSRKYLLGGFLYVLLVFTLIFPFMLFSLGSTVGVATHPTKFKIEVYMGSAEPLFQSHTSEKTVQRPTATFGAYRWYGSELEDIRGTHSQLNMVLVTSYTDDHASSMQAQISKWVNIISNDEKYCKYYDRRQGRLQHETQEQIVNILVSLTSAHGNNNHASIRMNLDKQDQEQEETVLRESWSWP